MKIQISEHFNYKKLLLFVLPSVVMSVFTQIYGVVDGLFVSNVVGKVPFAAVNLIMPVLMILGAIGLMFGTGGSALIAKTLGEGDNDRANRYFSLFITAIIVFGIVCGIVGFAFLRPVSALLGAEGETLDYCVEYGRVLMFALPALMLQYAFQSFLVTAGKPQIGLFVTVAAGVANAALDALFIAVFRWGLFGAALATALGQVIGGIVPFVYFLFPNGSSLRLCAAEFSGKALLRAGTNGASELLTNISSSVVNILYNLQLMKFAGEDGVAAYGVLMYVNFVFMGIFFGYSMGVAPVVGYHYGAENKEELKGLYRKSLLLNAIGGVVMTGLAEALSYPLSRLFVGYDAELCALTCRGLRFYALAFLFMGFNVFGSGFYTALNNGAVSAAISFVRTLLFQCGAVLLLPLWWEIDGIWCSVVVAELLALFVTITFFLSKKKRYGY